MGGGRRERRRKDARARLNGRWREWLLARLPISDAPLSWELADALTESGHRPGEGRAEAGCPAWVAELVIAADAPDWAATYERHRPPLLRALLVTAAAERLLPAEVAWSAAFDSLLQAPTERAARVLYDALPQRPTARGELREAFLGAVGAKRRLTLARLLVHAVLRHGSPDAVEREILLWWLAHEPLPRNREWACRRLREIDIVAPVTELPPRTTAEWASGRVARIALPLAGLAVALTLLWAGPGTAPAGSMAGLPTTTERTEPSTLRSVQGAWGSTTSQARTAVEGLLSRLDQAPVSAATLRRWSLDTDTVGVRLVARPNSLYVWSAGYPATAVAAAAQRLLDGLPSDRTYRWRAWKGEEGWRLAVVPEPSWAEAAPAEQGPPRAVLVFGGDVMLSGDLAGLVRRNGPDWPFRHLADAVRGSDGLVVNLETPLTTGTLPTPLKTAEELSRKQEFIFAAPPSSAAALQRAGVVAVTLGNNHALDHGAGGLRNTLTALADAGIAAGGAGPDAATARRPIRIRTSRGLVVALLSYCAANTLPRPARFEAGDGPGLALLWPEGAGLSAASRALLQDGVREAQTSADVVLVALHAGSEGSTTPTDFQRAVARVAIDAGADGFLGHHPHCVQPIEWYRGRPVLYSLGNLVFSGYDAPHLWETVLVRMTFSVHGVERVELAPVRIRGCCPEPSLDPDLLNHLRPRLQPPSGS